MIIGHKRVLDFLKKSVEKKRLAHAYLFAGSSHLGKKKVALEFIRSLNGKEIKGFDPDVLIVEPEVIEKNGIKKESEIGISQARKIQHQMSLYPYSASYKVALVDGAEKMTTEASNCLLKTLEEPTGKAILILITSNPKSLLPTIVSRCQLVNFLPVSDKEMEKVLGKEKNFKQVVRLANGRPGLAIKYLEEPGLIEKQEKTISELERLLGSDLGERYQYAETISKDSLLARQILETWLFWFRDLILLKTGCSDLILYPQSSNHQNSYSVLKLKQIIKAIKKTDFLLSNPSINARLALEVLMLEI